VSGPAMSDDDLAVSIGAMVRALRERKLLSQEGLAARSGLSVGTIRGLESGRIRRPRSSSVRRLADSLEVTGVERETLIAAALGNAHSLDVTGMKRQPATVAEPDGQPGSAAEPDGQPGSAAEPDGQPDSTAEPGSTAEPNSATDRGDTVPAQLPVAVRGFAGRVDAIKALDEMLSRDDDSPTAVVITAIAGMAGVGKTALAVHWAHRVADRFPDGQLYVNLRGFDATAVPTTPAGVARSLLETLGVPAHRIPSTVDAQLGLYRSLLAVRRMLILLDNARDPEQVRPLLPGAPGCLVLITSRGELSGLVATEDARPLALDLLPDGEAHDLLALRLGADRVAAEAQAVDDIVRGCAGLPLALAIVAARAATRPHLPLAALAAQLADARQRLDALSGRDPATDVRAVFSWSYWTLADPAARMLRLIGLHPGPDFTAPVAAALADVPVERARQLLAELASAHLVHEHSPGRYALHDLVRVYALEMANNTDSSTDRDAARRRMFDHYLHTAHMANRFIQPLRNPIPLPPPEQGVSVDAFETFEHALQWCAGEQPVLLAVITSAAQQGFDTHVWRLVREANASFDIRGLWEDSVLIGQLAVSSAQRCRDPAGQAYAHRVLGIACHRVGRYDEAQEHITRSLELFGAVDDARGQAWNHTTLGLLCEKKGDLDGALAHARHALEVFEAIDDIDGKAQSLNSIGWFQTLRGDHQGALASCSRALVLYQELGSRIGQAYTLHSIGHTHQQLGHHPKAMEYLTRVTEMVREIGDRHLEGWTLACMGDSYLAEGETEAARDAWRQALHILKDIGHTGTGEIEAKLTSVTTARSA
jgi:tetratricopeptide (TPR) repeat protein/transcriptional regulator with XRE-family HTH domain